MSLFGLTLTRLEEDYQHSWLRSHLSLKQAIWDQSPRSAQNRKVVARFGETMPVDNSRLSGFYKLSVPERRAMLAELAGLSDEQVQAWADLSLIHI